MSADSISPSDIDPKDLEDPSGLIKLGLQLLRTGLPDGDLELQASILQTCSYDELSAAVSAAAAFELNFIAEALGLSREEVLQNMLEVVPDRLR